MKNSVTILILCIIACIFTDVRAMPNSKVIVLDDVEYIIVGTAMSKKTISRNSLLSFHRIFTSSIESLSEDFNIRLPSGFRVFLCVTANDFGKLTGQNWYVAGLYDPVPDRFYFQNPDSLARRGVLGTVIHHELCHRFIKEARRFHRFSGRSEEFSWLEESLCEALFPVQGTLDVSAGYLLRTISTTGALKHRISTGLKSGNRIRRQRAYRLAFLWGSFLLRNGGRKKILAILVGKGDTGYLEKKFSSFRKSY